MGPHVISVVGALVTDKIMVINRMPEKGESLRANRYQESLGGKGANAAIATQRSCHRRPDSAKATRSPTASAPSEDAAAAPPPLLRDDSDEIHVRMVGAVGNDAAADKFQAALEESGVNTAGLWRVPEQQTGFGFITVEQFTGDNSCIFNYAATDAWSEEHFRRVEDLGHGVRPDLVIAQLEIQKEVVQQMLETAGAAGIDFLLNAAPAFAITQGSYHHITHLLLNETEAAILSGRDLVEVHEGTWLQIAREFVDRGVQNVVLTLGENGAFFATRTKAGHVPAYKVKVVDATGAGDTFTGTYASDYVRQKASGRTAADWDIRRAVERSNKASALTIGTLGAQVGIPWEDEIDQFDAELNIIRPPESNDDGKTLEGSENAEVEVAVTPNAESRPLVV